MEKVGRWDESVALSLELMRDAGASLFNRVNSLISLGKIRARPGETGVWDCLDEATAAAEGSGEPQWIVAARLARAEACWLDGKQDAALREVGGSRPTAAATTGR